MRDLINDNRNRDRNNNHHDPTFLPLLKRTLRPFAVADNNFNNNNTAEEEARSTDSSIVFLRQAIPD